MTFLTRGSLFEAKFSRHRTTLKTLRNNQNSQWSMKWGPVLIKVHLVVSSRIFRKICFTGWQWVYEHRLVPDDDFSTFSQFSRSATNHADNQQEWLMGCVTLCISGEVYSTHSLQDEYGCMKAGYYALLGAVLGIRLNSRRIFSRIVIALLSRYAGFIELLLWN